ncbi:hypothetical protein NGUA06_04088 [Salmonella enterica]|nr:hypothetical protein NGUA06_04088 [Salmonella enterica]
MKREQYSVEQIVAALKQAELGMSVADLGRQLGIPALCRHRATAPDERHTRHPPLWIGASGKVALGGASNVG